jgi:hypothetical protein
MRQLCSTFMRDVPRVINSKDWQLKHRCVILYKESSRKQRTTFYRRYPQEAGWLAIITGSDMARPDLLMQQLASGMASSRVFSFIWTNFEDSPDSSRLDSSYGKAKKCHPRPHAPPRDIAGGFDADGGARGGGSGGGGGGSVAEERDERHIEREKARAIHVVCSHAHGYPALASNICIGLLSHICLPWRRRFPRGAGLLARRRRAHARATL